MISYEYFRYSDPERSFKTSLTLFPSLTDFGRWRADFNTDLDIEFIMDFSWVLGLFARYDSDPLSKEGASSDYGVTSTLKYDF